MKKRMTISITLGVALLGIGFTNENAAAKSTKQPIVQQFFTKKNINLYQKNQAIINRVNEQNKRDKQSHQLGEPLRNIEPVVFDIPYTGLIRSSKNSVVYVRQGKQLLFKGASGGILVFNTKNWKKFSASKSIKVYARHAHQKLSNKKVFKFANYTTVLK